MCESLFRQEILSAITLAFVLIHCELMPSGELMSNKQKNLVRSQPILDFLQAPVVQLSKDVLLVTLTRTGCRSLVMLDVKITWSDAQ